MRRVAGARWRVLAHRWNPKSRMYGNSFDAGSLVVGPASDPWRESVSTPDMEFDELVVDDWLHVEGMSSRSFWLDVAGVVINVQVNRRGKPTKILVELERRDGVEYSGEVG